MMTLHRVSTDTAAGMGVGVELVSVLVVDDDPTAKDFARDILQRYGYNVLTAQSGLEAAMMLEESGGKIASVLIDEVISWSESGKNFRRALHKNPDIKIIITSGYSHSWAGDDYSSCHAAGFLKKPYRVAELLHAIEKARNIQ